MPSKTKKPEPKKKPPADKQRDQLRRQQIIKYVLVAVVVIILIVIALWWDYTIKNVDMTSWDWQTDIFVGLFFVPTVALLAAFFTWVPKEHKGEALWQIGMFLIVFIPLLVLSWLLFMPSLTS